MRNLPGSILVLLLGAAGVHAQGTVTLERSDGAAVGMMTYEPAPASCRGTAVVSHGAGGSETGFKYLANALLAEDWLVLVVGHKESSMDAVRGQMRGKGLKAALEGLITEPSAYRARFMDIEAALTWSAAHCKSPFKVLIGHSMGAATVMLEAGAANKLGLQGQGGFDAYVALSPQGPGSIFPDGAWQRIRRPVLMITGTRDNELNGEWTARLEPFKNMAPGCKWLGVIDGATHLNLAGMGVSGKTEDLTTKTTLAFLSGASNAPDRRCAAPPASRGIELQTK